MPADCQVVNPTFPRMHTPLAFTPLDVVGALRMSLSASVDDDDVRFDAAIRGENDTAIPPVAKGRADSFGEIDFSVGHGAFLHSVVAV